MARNQEKAQAMLNRYVQGKKDEAAAPIERRPFRASDVHDVDEAIKWRRQIVRDISRGVAEIQNGGMGEHKIRDLNDRINKLLRERKHWDRQIKSLGGPDYAAHERQVMDSDGGRAMGEDGYFYFGAARELPGVRELFEKKAPTKKKRTRGEMFKNINADYYGYGDEDDGVLVRVEAAAEKKQRREAVKKWCNENGAAAAEGDDDEGDDDAAAQRRFRAHVELPSQDAIEAAIMARKKEMLLAKYGGGQ